MTTNRQMMKDAITSEVTMTRAGKGYEAKPQKRAKIRLASLSSISSCSTEKIYGTFFLEVAFYLPIEIFSWIAWSKHRDEIEPEKTKAKKLSMLQNILVAILVRMNGTAAWLDAFTLSIGIVAVKNATP